MPRSEVACRCKAAGYTAFCACSHVQYEERGQLRRSRGGLLVQAVPLKLAGCREFGMQLGPCCP